MMKLYFYSLVLTGLLGSFCPLHSQDKLIKDYRISAWFGFRYMDRDSFQKNENLDFVNYMLDDPEGGYPEYEYLGFGLLLDLRNDWLIDLQIAMYDDFVPNNLNLSVQKGITDYLGVCAGFYGNPILINDWPNYHKVNDEGYYGDVNRGFRQRYVFEYGLMVGPAFNFKYKFFNLSAKISAGYSFYSRFEEYVLNKEINSNRLVLYKYQTRFSPAFYFYPEIELGFDVIRTQNFQYGIQLQSVAYWSTRSIDYTRTRYEWMENNSVISDINSPGHTITKFQMDLGIYMRF